MTDHDQQYDAGRRDADIETCKVQMQYVLTRLQIVEGWQNRAIGYVAAIVLLGQIALNQWGIL